MKFFVMLTLATFTSMTFAATPDADWKVVSETANCPHSLQIKAKPGEKYVIVVNGKTEEKLFSKDGSGFNQESMNAIEYKSKNYQFIQPSYVENRPAKIEISQNGKMMTRCPLLNK